MSDLLSAQEEKLNIEVFSELPGPRGIIVSSLCESTNQRFAVIKDPAMRKLAVYQLKCIARIS